MEATLGDFIAQAELVLTHYAQQVMAGSEPPAQRVNFNWMARGEPLDNRVVTQHWEEIVGALTQICIDVGIDNINFNISSIVPTSYSNDFAFSGSVQPHIYYSLYSMNQSFRKRWLPKAHDPIDVLPKLVEWQKRTKGLVTLHWAMIEGENDDPNTMDEIVQTVVKSGLDAKFNLVRYNPYSEGQGTEPAESVLQERFKQITPIMKLQGSRIVPRVGFDVKASCGMFVPKSEIGS